MKKTKIIHHKERINGPLLKILAFCSFLLGISSALILYLESDYFKKSLGSDNVTFYFIVAYLLALVLVFNWHHLVKRYGKVRVFLVNITLKTFVVLAIGILPVGRVGSMLLVLYIISTVLMWIDLDVLLESCSKDIKTGRIRGAYLTIMNAGYLISPFFAGLIISEWGINSVFLFAALILAVVSIITFLQLKKIPDCSMEDLSFFSLMRKVIQRKNVMRIYYISFLLELFYALMIVYTPLYLLELGFGWGEIGEMFTIMLIPFVLLQYPAGVLADKRFEEKDMIFFALLIMSVFTVAMFFISSKDFVVWTAVLFATRIGASLIEILRDSYFYKRIDQTDVDIVDFFRSVRPMAYILGLIVATPIVFILHIRFIFPFVGIMMLTGLPFAFKLASSRIPPVYGQLSGRIKR
ncbi:MAG: MFS transporter [Parcubacteria group bacterium]|jgi:MFS family permease